MRGKNTYATVFSYATLGFIRHKSECQPGEVLKIIAHYKIIYLNINSLLLKIYELFPLGKSIITDITEISGVKLDDLFLQPKIQIENYMF